MKRFLLTILLGAGALNAAAPDSNAKPRPAARAKRRSVLDYYYLLPYLGNFGNDTRREKSELLKPSSNEGFTPIVDLRHDYIEVGPDSAPVEQIAVFRSGGPDLIATSSPDYESDYNGFQLWRLQNGKLRDVTRQVLPFPVRPNELAYELPRVGTTIHVFRFSLEPKTRKPAFDLLWRRGRFVMQRPR